MAPPLSIKSDLLRPLASFGVVAQGAAVYYRELRNSKDPIIAAGAWCNLLDGRLVSPAMADELLPFCRFAAVRARAFRHFQTMYEHESATRIANMGGASREDAERAAMLAELGGDAAAAALAAGDLFLASGDLSHLETASQKAEAVAGWRGALEWALRPVVIAPLNPLPLQRLYVVLESSGQADLLDEVASIFLSRNLHLPIAQIFAATAALTRGDAASCLAKLKPLDDAKVMANKALVPYLGHIRSLRAQAEEKLKHYQAAYAGYLALNAADRAADVNPEDFFRGIVARGRLAVPALPPERRHDVVQMLGFPRSGTTLLENALNAHPMIETFEEISALNVAIDRIERAIMGKGNADLPAEAYLEARARYYSEIDLLRRKAGASLLIDKMPIRSADATFLGKLFPNWLYIFSIRHPYDVVLSCFKQRFLPNPAMENFRSIDQAARAYDFTLTEWFKHHSMDDAKVHYVRYDDLVTDFEPAMRGVLGYLELDWNNSVLDFSKSAENRAAVTPSYHKVRQGLSIGVQTQWRNYRFAFESEATKPLKNWAEFFGYPTE
ncbi:MAG: sulfotransferase [Devosia sp.]